MIDDVSNHGFDVFHVEWSCAWQAKVDFLHAEVFHEGQQLDFLLNGRVPCTWALKTITKCLIVEPDTVRVICRVSSEIILDCVPIINQ